MPGMSTTRISLLALLLLVLLGTAPSAATPVEILLYRDGAIITENRKLRVMPAEDGQRQVSFPLPPGFLPSSLTVRLPGAARWFISGVEVTPALFRREAEGTGLQKRIQNLEEERQKLQTRIAAEEGKFLFWQSQTKQRAKNPTEAQLWAQNIGLGLRKAREEKLKFEAGLRVIEEELKKQRDTLKRHAAISEHPWQVTVFIAGAPTTREIDLHWSYSLARSGWEPYYHLNALPPEGRLQVRRMARIKQDPVLPWNEARLFFVNGYLPGGIHSPLPLPWFISLKTPAVRGKADSKAAPRMEPLPPILAMDTLPQPPGGLTGLSDKTQMLQLGEESWPAEFFHLVRPHELTGAWLTGIAKGEASGRQPPGEALFFLEGAFLGKGFWHPQDSPKGLILGQDNLVKTLYSVERRDKAEIPPSQEPLKGYDITWRTEITNARPYQVTLRLQKPAPQFADPRVFSRHQYDPLPDQNHQETAIWQRTIPPGASALFSVSLSATFPANIDLPDLLRP